jgi:hypothetical protein
MLLQRRELTNALDKVDPSCEKGCQKSCKGEPMDTTKESGFEGPLPWSIKPDGFHCYWRGGCDSEALCEAAGECLGREPQQANALSRFGKIAGGERFGAPPLVNAPNRSRLGEIAEIECIGIPSLAKALLRNRVDEIAEMIRNLTYAEMLEFAGDLWRLRGRGKVNGETLPSILHAWATGAEATASDGAAQNEPAPSAGECHRGAERKFQPIDTAPKDRPILAFMLGRWRTAQWRHNHPHKRPIPFWSANDLRVTVSRANQPKWWTELPPSPPEAEV